MSDPVSSLQEAIDDTRGALIEVIGSSVLSEANRTALEALVTRLLEVRRKLPDINAQQRRKLVQEVVLEAIQVRDRLRASA